MTFLHTNDISKVIQDFNYFIQKNSESEETIKELRKVIDNYETQLSNIKKSEDNTKLKIQFLTQELEKSQKNINNHYEIKKENSELKDTLYKYKNKIDETNTNLEKERVLCHELLQKNRKDTDESLQNQQKRFNSEIERLKFKYTINEEMFRKQIKDLDQLINNLRQQKEDQNYELQEKINQLQMALSASQNENRNLRDRLEFNTVAYQKKIQEFERSIHPALSTTTNNSRNNKKKIPPPNLPQLDITFTDITPERNNQPQITKRRKLFNHNNTID